ncbi:hypothetical protein BC940DRAFT_136049 [Gongronella butleri]|nr:hypothetical protein BC940DRAFT_136049 [Gongronella butleri]
MALSILFMIPLIPCLVHPVRDHCPFFIFLQIFGRIDMQDDAVWFCRRAGHNHTDYQTSLIGCHFSQDERCKPRVSEKKWGDKARRGGWKGPVPEWTKGGESLGGLP